MLEILMVRIYEGCPLKNGTDFFTGIIYSPSSRSVCSFSMYSPWALMHLSHRFCQSSVTCENPFLDMSFRIASTTLTTATVESKRCPHCRASSGWGTERSHKLGALSGLYAGCGTQVTFTPAKFCMTMFPT